MHKIIIACDSYKGCLTSREVNEAIASGLRDDDADNGCPSDLDTVAIEMSDGGEGMLDAFLAATGGERVTLRTHDSLMRWIDACYGVVDTNRAGAAADSSTGTNEGKTAIIEIAQTAGLALIEPEQRNPLRTTSWGVGEMVMDAYHRGIRHFIVGLGGSATSDCGIGMLKAMGDDWQKVCRDSTFVLASDVTNPLCGQHGAARVFAPQKGADSAMVDTLEARAIRFAEACSRHFSYDRSDHPGAGAAGGLGYAFLQFFNAQFRPGAELLFEATDFDALLSDADTVVTGEGHSDAQTLMGKLPYRVLQHVMGKRTASRPQTWLVSGGVSDRQALCDAGFDRIVAVSPTTIPIHEAMLPKTAKANIVAATRLLRDVIKAQNVK